jgi:hypothetical protein
MKLRVNTSEEGAMSVAGEVLEPPICSQGKRGNGKKSVNSCIEVFVYTN